MLDDGRRVAAACLNSSAYREFCKEWADWVLECGRRLGLLGRARVGRAVHVGVDDPSRWTCRCDRCAERFGGPVPGGADAEVQALPRGVGRRLPRARWSRTSPRAAAEHDLPAALDRGHAGARRLERGRGRCPAWTTLVTDPYWKHWDELGGAVRAPLRPAAARDGRPARRRGAALGAELRAHARRHPRPRGGRSRRPREEGVDDLWTWGYEACGHMTHLATPDSPLVWEAVSAALTGVGRRRCDRGGAAGSRRPRSALDARPRAACSTRRTRPSPPRSPRRATQLAAAIDAIVERAAPRRPARLRRRRHVRARLRALDAAECGPTFGSPPGEVVAVVAERRRRDEDDRAAATNALRGLALRPEDCVVAVSASGCDAVRRSPRSRPRARRGALARRRRRAPRQRGRPRWPSTRSRSSSGPR